MVLTKIPMLPFGESLPPTTLNPSPFLPGPFSKVTVWTVHCCNELSDPDWPAPDASLSVEDDQLLSDR